MHLDVSLGRDPLLQPRRCVLGFFLSNKAIKSVIDKTENVHTTALKCSKNFSVSFLFCLRSLQQEQSGLHLMLLGGIIYVVGIIFFKLDGHIPMAHAIWHCFVMVGAFLHYCAVDSFLIVG
ncbi:unnamed protein product [Echinostoma caproni]|uniref:Monocyte to macrophage differentiation factor 2 n=1 Tax=Echinostoma caproni TaxID=27848 RepID=A0A183A9H6_9TREM|nr:unnamed protein product [Echinostoma caproni]